ncbi:MAG: hypothetical protein FJZ00_13540 [Candidatus Sericytochromatia bacterium]|uniref:Uncharacterized protein n=1 Tax=Candidatus Tanganyikabacteria bacterium TaxID=2961651 RepID=A0A938BMB3_9BACT|nr:hypothetical protein [Candidatus Tanganyikabacteria bacterium]
MAIGGAAYFQFDLIMRSLPKGKGSQIGAKAKPADPNVVGQDYEDLMAKIEANKQTPEDVKRLDDLMAKIESGQTNFSHIDPKKLERLNKIAAKTGKRGASSADDEGAAERADRRAAFDEADDGISVGSGDSASSDESDGSGDSGAPGGKSAKRAGPQGAGAPQGGDWAPIAAAREWFAMARDEIVRRMPQGDKK